MTRFAISMVGAVLLLCATPVPAKADKKTAVMQKARARTPGLAPGLISEANAIKAVLPVVNARIGEWNKDPAKQTKFRAVTADKIQIRKDPVAWQAELTSFGNGTAYVGGSLDLAAPFKRARKSVKLTWGLEGRR